MLLTEKISQRLRKEGIRVSQRELETLTPLFEGSQIYNVRGHKKNAIVVIEGENIEVFTLMLL